MAKKKDFHAKKPGQQFEEIEAEQRRRRQARRKEEDGASPIDNIDKSRQRDKEELKKLADQARTEPKPRQNTLADAPSEQSQQTGSSEELGE